MNTNDNDDGIATLNATLAMALATEIGGTMLAGKNPEVVEQALGICLSIHMLSLHKRPERPGALHQWMLNVAKLMPVIERAAKRDGVELKHPTPWTPRPPKAH